MADQKLRVPPCPRRTSGHAWRLDWECSTTACEAYVCRACGVVRMTSYRTGQVVRYEKAGQRIRTPPRPEPSAGRSPGNGGSGMRGGRRRGSGSR